MAINPKTRVRNGQKETFYEVFVSGKDHLGNRVQKKRRVRNKAQAKALEIELLNEIEELRKNGPSKTFADFLPEYYEYVEKVKKKTIGSIKSEQASLNNHALPFLGDKVLTTIEPCHIEHILEVILKEKAGQTKRHCLNYLNALFKLALRRRLIDKNPCDNVERPRVRRKNKVILNYEQIQEFLACTEHFFPEWMPHFMVVLHTALRASEARGLRWSNIDWDKNLIYIYQTFTVKDGVRSNTKAGPSRVVPLNPDLKEFLSELRKEVNPEPNDWLLERHPEFMRSEQAKVVRDVCKVAKLPECTFHQLRAGAITNFLRHGVPLGQVMKIAGHSRISSTEIYYDHAGEQVVGTTNHISFKKKMKKDED